MLSLVLRRMQDKQTHSTTSYKHNAHAHYWWWKYLQKSLAFKSHHKSAGEQYNITWYCIYNIWSKTEWQPASHIAVDHVCNFLELGWKEMIIAKLGSILWTCGCWVIIQMKQSVCLSPRSSLITIHLSQLLPVVCTSQWVDLIIGGTTRNPVGHTIIVCPCPLPTTLKLSSCPFGSHSRITQPLTTALVPMLHTSLEWCQCIKYGGHWGLNLAVEAVNVIRRADVNIGHLQFQCKVLQIHKAEISEWV